MITSKQINKVLYDRNMRLDAYRQQRQTDRLTKGGTDTKQPKEAQIPSKTDTKQYQCKHQSSKSSSWSFASWIPGKSFFTELWTRGSNVVYPSIWLLFAMTLLDTISRGSLLTAVPSNQNASAHIFGDRRHVLDGIMTSEQKTQLIGSLFANQSEVPLHINCDEVRKKCEDQVDSMIRECIPKQKKDKSLECLNITLKDITNWTESPCHNKSNKIEETFKILNSTITADIVNLFGNVPNFMYSSLTVISHVVIHTKPDNYSQTMFHIIVLLILSLFKWIDYPVVELGNGFILNQGDFLERLRISLFDWWTRAFQQDTATDTIRLYFISFMLSTMLLQSGKGVNCTYRVLVRIMKRNTNATEEDNNNDIDNMLESMFGCFGAYLPAWWTIRLHFMDGSMGFILGYCDDPDFVVFLFRTVFLNFPNLIASLFEKKKWDVVDIIALAVQYAFVNFFVIVPMENRIINLMQIRALEHEAYNFK